MTNTNNKHYFIKSIIAFVLLSFVSAGTALAIDIDIINTITTSDFTKIVSNFIKWSLGVAGSVALVALIVGGVMYMTSAGEEQKATQAKKLILWTIIGLVVILLSYAILSLINEIFVK